ncbi:hypothetical protein D3C77_502600 [compost metagenome]
MLLSAGRLIICATAAIKKEQMIRVNGSICTAYADNCSGNSSDNSALPAMGESATFLTFATAVLITSCRLFAKLKSNSEVLINNIARVDINTATVPLKITLIADTLFL